MITHQYYNCSNPTFGDTAISNFIGGHIGFCWKPFCLFLVASINRCSIVILDPTNLSLHTTIITVAITHSELQPFQIALAEILYFMGSHFLYLWLFSLDSCSIVILDPKNLWLHITIITVSIIHSEIQPFQISLAAILDFVGNHFVYFWLYLLDKCSILILDPKKLWLHSKIITVSIINTEIQPFQISLVAILDFVGSHFVYFWFFSLDSCSIVILDPKNLWLHITIITVAIIHSEIQPFQISLATILYFVGNHFVYFSLYLLDNCSIPILDPKKLWLHSKIIIVAIINSEIQPFQISLVAILDFVGSRFVYFWLFSLDSCSIVILDPKNQ